MSVSDDDDNVRAKTQSCLLFHIFEEDKKKDLYQSVEMKTDSVATELLPM